MRRRFGNERGFTLIETLAAITVFSIMVLGIAPLLASSLKGAALSRSYARGKDIGQGAMERVRGLPYFDAAAKRDVIDLYFPDLVVGTGGSGYSTTTKTFTTICTSTSQLPAVSGALACPPKRPDGTSSIPSTYTVTFTAQFVAPVANSNPETYNVITPPAGFTSASSAPPAQLLRFTVKVSWQQGAKAAQFSLLSLLGDRKLSPDKVRASSNLDFLAQTLTSYRVPDGQPNAGRLSTFRAFSGRLQSVVGLKNFASADQSSRAAQMTLNQQEFAGAAGFVVTDAAGAQSVLNAPPSTSPAPVITSSAGTTVSAPPGITIAGGIGGMSQTRVNEALSPNPAAVVTNELPRAAGNFGFVPGSNGAGGEEFWVTNQADTSNQALLGLVPGAHVFSVQQPANGNQAKRIFGSSYAETFPVSPTALRVRATTKAQAQTINLLPTTYNSSKPLITFDGFTATTDCQVSGTAATATGSWTVNMTIKTAAGNINRTLSGSTTAGQATDTLSLIRTSNPLVGGVAGTGSAVYLFDETGKPGFLDSWSYTPLMTASTPDTKTAKVSMPYAFTITTAKTDPSNPESKLTISVGGMSCEASDVRS
ncbi:MAG: hypothetical protein QOH90_895 [Actinomycetota bacterium]|nr:hypothetical protein [Actinomycetota bacterium]